MRLRNKVFLDIVAIMFFLLGIVIIHVVQNASNQTFYVFDSKTQETFVFDIGLILIGLGFFLEFGLKFKPMMVKRD